jgi:1,4-dihydroxy-2-naphthoate octaprenyltransferase
MLLAFDLPDSRADEATGKRTLYVRLGRGRAVLLHRLTLVAAYGLLLAAGLTGVPTLVVLSGALAFPLALAQAITFPWLASAAESGNEPPIPYGSVTFGGVALFAVTAGLMAFGYWRVG